MATEQVKQFLALLEKDSALQKKVQDADTAFARSHPNIGKKEALTAILLPIAKEAGFDFTAEEFMESTKQPSGELNDDELANVSGGWLTCFFLGISNEAKKSADSYGLAACAIVGIGIGWDLID